MQIPYFLREEPLRTDNSTQNIRQLVVAGEEETCMNKWTFCNLSIRGLVQKKPRKASSHVALCSKFSMRESLPTRSLPWSTGLMKYIRRFQPWLQISREIFGVGRNQTSVLLKVPQMILMCSQDWEPLSYREWFSEQLFQEFLLFSLKPNYYNLFL